MEDARATSRSHPLRRGHFMHCTPAFPSRVLKFRCGADEAAFPGEEHMREHRMEGAWMTLGSRALPLGLWTARLWTFVQERNLIYLAEPQSCESLLQHLACAWINGMTEKELEFLIEVPEEMGTFLRDLWLPVRSGPNANLNLNKGNKQKNPHRETFCKTIGLDF